jgi:hypothetical protein
MHLGSGAGLYQRKYSVMVHGVQVSKLGLTDTNNKIITEGIQQENHLIIEDIQIQKVSWLNPKAAETKNHTTVVLDFTHPGQANKAIEQGIIIGAKRHDCELYDRTCQLKQCFVCHKYGHIGSRCGASQLCGFCAESHKTQNYPSKGAAPGAPPKCAVCAGPHTAWSRACAERAKEYKRIDFAKKTHPRLHPEQSPPLGDTILVPATPQRPQATPQGPPATPPARRASVPTSEDFAQLFSASAPVFASAGPPSSAPAAVATGRITKTRGKKILVARKSRKSAPADQLLGELSAARCPQPEAST